MAEITHHLTDALLMAYAAGSLPEAFSLVAATHVSLCDECRARLGAYDSLGGALVEEAEAAALDGTALDETLRRIAAPPREDTPASAQRRPGAFPFPLAAYAGQGPEAVRWRAVGGGVKQAILATSRRATARLLHIPAGTAIPEHGHRGIELTLVLQGAFADGRARFGPGDLEVAGAADEHQPVAEAGADCICLAATDAPLRFSGLIPRLAQPFLRI